MPAASSTSALYNDFDIIMTHQFDCAVTVTVIVTVTVTVTSALYNDFDIAMFLAPFLPARCCARHHPRAPCPSLDLRLIYVAPLDVSY